jgi:hypothetical protein
LGGEEYFFEGGGWEDVSVRRDGLEEVVRERWKEGWERDGREGRGWEGERREDGRGRSNEYLLNDRP